MTEFSVCLEADQKISNSLVCILERLAISPIQKSRNIYHSTTYGVDLWKNFLKKFKIRASRSLQNSTNFWQFSPYIFEFWQYFLKPTIIIGFGRLNLPIEIKFHKKLLVGVLWGCIAKFRQGKLLEFWRLLEVRILNFSKNFFHRSAH